MIGEVGGALDKLLEHGPIGIVCVLLIVWQIRLYMDARSDRDAFTTALDVARKEHQKQEDEKDAQILTVSLAHAKAMAESTALMQRVVRYLEKS